MTTAGNVEVAMLSRAAASDIWLMRAVSRLIYGGAEDNTLYRRGSDGIVKASARQLRQRDVFSLAPTRSTPSATRCAP
jgi:hypothetical protein